MGRLTLLAFGVLVAVAVPGSSPRITLSDPARDYQLRAAAMSQDGEAIHLISASHPKGQSQANEPLLWTIVDSSGKVVSQDDPLARLPPATASSIARGPDAGTALAVSGDGVANLILRTTAGGLCLLRLRRAPEAAIVLPVDFGRGGVDVRSMRPFPGDRLLLLGTIGEQPLAAVIALDGKVVTRYQVPQQSLNVVNAVVEPDGSLVIVCWKGELFHATTWVGRLAPAGTVVATKEFPGRPTDVARGSDGTILVLLETNGTAIVAKGLGPGLAEQWTRTLVSGLPVPGASFHAAAIRSGGFAVNGTKNRALWVARLKADGSEMWADTTDPATSPDMEMASHVELLSAGDAFAAAYSAAVVVGREQRGMIRAFRFTVN